MLLPQSGDGRGEVLAGHRDRLLEDHGQSGLFGLLALLPSIAVKELPPKQEKTTKKKGGGRGGEGRGEGGVCSLRGSFPVKLPSTNPSLYLDREMREP